MSTQRKIVYVIGALVALAFAAGISLNLSINNTSVLGDEIVSKNGVDFNRVTLSQEVKDDAATIKALETDIATLSDNGNGQVCIQKIILIDQLMQNREITFSGTGPVVFEMSSSTLLSTTLNFPEAKAQMGLYLINTRDSIIADDTFNFHNASSSPKAIYQSK